MAFGPAFGPKHMEAETREARTHVTATNPNISTSFNNGFKI